jgi:sugar-phosphatase
MIQALIFDMDGLLIDSEPLWRKAEIEVFAKVGIRLSQDDCKETMGYRLNEVVDLWYARQPWEGLSKREIEEGILDRVSELILSEGKVMEGVHKTIQSCMDLNLKMAIASSSPMKLIMSVVQLLGMERSFDVLHSAEFESYGKPHPAVFISTSNKLGVSPHNCLVLEDSLHGVISALAAKMKVVAVPDSDQYSNPKFRIADRVLKSLNELNLEAELQELTK